MNTTSNDIVFPPLPKSEALKSSLDFLDNLIQDCILYLAYGIALLSVFKFIVYIANGFATKSYMGPSFMDDTSFSGRTNWPG
jgi:hypothetical protein